MGERGARGWRILYETEEIVLAQGIGRDALQLHAPPTKRETEPCRLASIWSEV